MPDQSGPSEAGSEKPAGLTSHRSAYGLDETVSRVIMTLTDQGMGLFAKINHTAIAAEAGMALRPTVLLLLDQPTVSAHLMHAQQTVGIDLPLKVLVWEDQSGQIWVSYNEPLYIAARHHLDLHAIPTGEAVLTAKEALAELARVAE